MAGVNNCLIVRWNGLRYGSTTHDGVIDYGWLAVWQVSETVEKPDGPIGEIKKLN